MTLNATPCSSRHNRLAGRAPVVHRGRARGQSLVEFAATAPILVMLAFGLVDLGRAFFTLIQLQSMISEGTHWAAAYPECIATAYNVTSAPQVPSGCRGTNSILGRMLNEGTNLEKSRFVTLSISPTSALPGDLLTLTVSYKMELITPLSRALFGSTLTLTAQGKEVVRGSGDPDYAGDGMTDNGSVPPVNPPTNVQQNPTSCTSGSATITWTAVSATGYRIFKGAVSPPFPTPFYTMTSGGTIGSTISYTYSISTSGASGSQVFTITAYNDDGTTLTDSDPVQVTASCSAIKPVIEGYTCGTNTATFLWSMPTPIDLSVAGYALYRIDGVNSYTLLSPTVSGSTATTGTVSFNNTAAKTKSYVVSAIDSVGVAIGNLSDPVAIACS